MAILLVDNVAGWFSVNGLVWFASLATVSVCVLLHYECIRVLVYLYRRFSPPPRVALPGVVMSMLVCHVLQALLFAVAMMVLVHTGGEAVGVLEGAEDLTFGDAAYFSLIVFTTVGFGDITPVGALRTLTGIQSLCGLMLITWSASFTFLMMERCFRTSLNVGESGRTAPHPFAE